MEQYAQQYDQLQTISNIPQAINHGPVKAQFGCTICATYFKTYQRLRKHMERFHAAFNQEEKGEKRKNIRTDEGHITKRVKSGDNLEIQYIKDDDLEKMSNALKALEGKNNPQEEVFPRKAKWDWAESNEESQDEDSEGDGEMYGRGIKYQDIESEEDIDSNYDSGDNDGDEDNE